MFACIYIPDYSNQAVRYGANLDDALLDCAEAWSPRVEHAGAGTAVLDIEGLERLFGSYAEIATALRKKAGELGFSVHVGVASNPDAAIHTAKGFPGVTVVARGMETKRLKNLPISILAPPENIHKTLEHWGIRTFGALAALPANDIAVRLGDDGVRLHQLARGSAMRLLVPRKDPLRFVESMDLDYEITLLEPLTFILTRLLGQICARLKCRNLATHEIHLKLSSLEYVLRLPIPTQDSKLLLKLLELDVAAHPPQATISTVTVEAIQTGPRVVQHGLFVPLSPEPEKLELTLARIAAIVGQENVGAAELLDTHRPGAFRMRRFIATSGNDPQKMHPREQQTAMAFRTFRPPLESTVEMCEGRPQWIAFSGAHGPIVSASGPWRTSGDWWTHEPWNRDEWDIAMSSASSVSSASAASGDVTLYRIYRDCIRRRWFVEGVYD